MSSLSASTCVDPILLLAGLHAKFGVHSVFRQRRGACRRHQYPWQWRTANVAATVRAQVRVVGWRWR